MSFIKKIRAATKNKSIELRGMREGAVELIKKQIGHVRVVHNLLGELTGIQIPKVEDWIESSIP